MTESSIRDLLGARIVPAPPATSGDGSKAGTVGCSDHPANSETSNAAGEDDASVADNAPGAGAFVYVPVQPRKPGADPDAVMFELRSLDGEAGLAVYTERERLIAELGEYQPHVRIPVLDLLVQFGPHRVPIAVDPSLAPGADRWTEESIKSWQTPVEER